MKNREALKAFVADSSRFTVPVKRKLKNDNYQGIYLRKKREELQLTPRWFCIR